MNVKVKLPNLRRWKTGSSSLSKELMMSVIGTTISILLTFGTAHLIERNQRKAEGRDVAMMVIHDIDMYAESFRDEAENDAKNHDLAMYVLEHIDSIEKIPFDTISSVISYISYLEGNGYKFDESIEKTFQSDQEIWRSIDAPPFIDQARAFFHDRRMTFQMLNTSINFRRPVTQEEMRQIYATALSTGKGIDWCDFLRKRLKDEDVQLYIHLHDERQNLLNSTADDYQDMSNRCRFIMNITDEELQAFLDKRMRTGEKLTDSKLYGKWTTQDKQPQTFEFNRDHTFKQTAERHFPSSAYHGILKVTYAYTGRWEIKGDSLYRYYDAGCDYKIDRSSITYSPEKRDAVEEYFKQFEENLAAMNERQKNESIDTKVRAAVIDKTGNKVELTYPEDSSDRRITYLIREE